MRQAPRQARQSEMSWLRKVTGIFGKGPTPDEPVADAPVEEFPPALVAPVEPASDAQPPAHIPPTETVANPSLWIR